MKNNTFTPILIIAAIVRIAGLWVPDFWYDENFTLILARLPFERMIAATAGDVHPPLSYLISWVIIHIAPAAPAWVLRVPSVIFSLLAMVILRRLMREWSLPEKVQLGAMLLMALLPMQVWYAQEARMYALLEMLVLLALLYALRGNWIGLFAASLAMLYTQNYSLFYIASIGTVILIRDRRAIPYAAASFGLAGLLFAPWALVVARQISNVGNGYWIQQQHIGDALNIIYKLFFASAMPSFAILSAMMVTFIALAVGLLHMRYDRHSASLAIVVMAFAPLIMAWTVSELWKPILLHRPLIGASPFLYLIAAWSLNRLLAGEPLRVQREAVMASAMVIPILVSGLGGYYKNISAMKSDGAASPLIGSLDYVRAHWQAGDVIIFADDGPMINLLPYTDDLPRYLIPACGSRKNVGPSLGSLTLQTRAAIGVPVKQIDELTYTRAWVFAPFSPLNPQCYEDYIAPLTPGDPMIVVDDNQFIFSGVWLVTQ